MKRILLFLVTNIAVLLVLSVTLRLLGVDRILDAQGTGLDYNALLVMAAVIGFGGSFISLLISKWMAKTRDRRARDRSAVQHDRALAGRHGAAPGAARRHRHARSGDLRRAGDQRVRDGLEQERVRWSR